uniref:Uncharacterized protein n=1 Tax=Rhizophora mucronata TaxID=61149 RepID=A0A2P2NFT8_RHIMU
MVLKPMATEGMNSNHLFTTHACHLIFSPFMTKDLMATPLHSIYLSKKK